MDRRVKERLVGASILVVLIVLIVPELLSGPASPPARTAPAGTQEAGRTVTVDLATNKAPAQDVAGEAASAAHSPPVGEHAQASAADPPVLPAARAAPATPPASTASRSAPPALLETPVPPPTSMPGGAKPAAVGHSWAVQLGSFASRDNADKLVHQLKGQGFSVYVSSAGSGPAARYRVRIGPLTDHESAAQTVAKLKSLGQAASIVRPGA
jgi:DedD protein